MAASLLTVDLGNSAAKLRAWSVAPDGALRCSARLDLQHAAAPAPRDAELARFFAAAPGFELAALCSVAHPDTTRAWRERLSARAELDHDLDAGLENRTREPERVGRDRLFAARGALELLRESAIVVDAGTALTVDAVLAIGRGPGWQRGAFQGGAIAPGPALLARALAAGAAQLFEVEPRPAPPALGRDSTEALQAGIGIGLRGAARELALEIARAAGLEAAPVALTGGARAFVAGAFTGKRVLECEDLVHFGLAAALLERAGLPPPRPFGRR